jgi:hypothetical protein
MSSKVMGRFGCAPAVGASAAITKAVERAIASVCIKTPAWLRAAESRRRRQSLHRGAGDGFAESLARFGQGYADQPEKDWKDLKRSNRVGKP